MEGYLFKWTNIFQGYQERYFKLENNILNYFLKKGEPVKGKLHTKIIDVIESDEDEMKFSIEYGVGVLYLKAITLHDKEEWLKSLNYSKFNITLDTSRNSNLIQSCLTTKNSRLSKDTNLLKKVNFILESANKLQTINKSLEAHLKNQSNPEIIKLLNQHKVKF